MPPRSGTKQINPSVSTHTLEGLNKLELQWGCPQGQAIDRLYEWYEDFLAWRDEQHTILEGVRQELIQIRQMVSTDAETPAVPELPADPYNRLALAQVSPRLQEIVDPLPRRPSRWRRWFGHTR